MMLLRYTQESAQPFIYKGYALFISKLEISSILYILASGKEQYNKIILNFRLHFVTKL